MKYTTEKKDCKLTVSFKLNATEWAEFVQKAYEQTKGKYRVAGFRQGHAPKRTIENMYGAGIFDEDALYIAAQEYYSDFLDKNSDVEPVARPSIAPASVKINEKAVEFAVEVVVKPEVKLGAYKGLVIKKSKPETVKAEEVDAELNKVRERNARFVEVTDRAVAEGDEVTLDYSGSVDGVKFDGGTAEKQKLVIGSHTFIPGFEEQLVGMNIGETKDINVKFPEDYHSEELKGKDSVFTVTIHAITLKQLPELDDEFAKDVSEYSTLKEYKDSIKKTLKAEKERIAENKDENTLVEKIVDGATFTLPNEMVEEQIDDYIQEFSYQLSYQGLDINSYYKYTNTTESALRENYRERATKAVRTRLVFEAIIKAEKLQADADKVDEKIREYADEVGHSFEEVKAKLNSNQLYYFENQVLTDELLDMLKKENTFEK